MEDKEVVKERVRRFRERQKGGQPPRMGDVVPEWARGVNGTGKTATEIAMKDVSSSISPVLLEMIGGLEKRVAALEGAVADRALEADLLDRMVRLEDNVRDMQARKEPTRAIGSYHTKKDSPEDLFKRVVAEKAERLSIS